MGFKTSSVIFVVLVVALIYCVPTSDAQAWCNERLTGRKNSGYRGCQTVTRSGRTCQKWTSQYPHEHSRTPKNYPKSGLGDHNYCRNPDGEDTIWCYTTDKGDRWDYCNPLNFKNTNRRRSICEGSSGNIACPAGRVIDIQWAMYGRTNTVICHSFNMWDQNCMARTAEQKIRDMCQGKSNCGISAKNSVFGDPCYLTHKYVDVIYACVPMP